MSELANKKERIIHGVATRSSLSFSLSSFPFSSGNNFLRFPFVLSPKRTKKRLRVRSHHSPSLSLSLLFFVPLFGLQMIDYLSQENFTQLDSASEPALDATFSLPQNGGSKLSRSKEERSVAIVV